MDQEYTAFVNHPAKKPFDPYTTEVPHPDGAFFVLLCLFSWIIFIWLWAWNHKPRRRLSGIDKRRTQRWEVPSDYWRN
jgi:hypothetical protein